MEPLSDVRHEAYLQWLTTPPKERVPNSKNKYAEQIGVHPRTLRDWEAREEFRRAWAKRAEEVIGDPGKVQEVLEVLRQQALDPTHRQYAQAAKLYLEAVEAIKPPDKKVELKIDRDALKDFTDDELDARIAALMAEQQSVARAHTVLDGR
jgi:hypothetical protein